MAGSDHHTWPHRERTVSTSKYIVWFDQYHESDHSRVGGKNASLGTMMAAGLPVPPGFAVTTLAFHSLRENSELYWRVTRALEEIDLTDPIGLRRISAHIRALIEANPLAPDIESAIRDSYAALCDRCGTNDVPVAVRSSATAEDLPDASFAGQQDTYLWVIGAEAVVEHVQKCWSSIFTDRAIAYRHEMGHDHDLISMSVGVQKMVDPLAAGVAFTLNPMNGDRSQVAIDASWGLGEAVVGGEVTPDNFLVDKVIREIVGRIVSPKDIEYRVNGSNEVEKIDVEPERRLVPCLTDDEIRAVAAMARRAEKYYGYPQDIEWALDRHLPAGENVLLLQARPETVWSRRPAKPIEAPADPMQSIISTLITPIHARENKTIP